MRSRDLRVFLFCLFFFQQTLKNCKSKTNDPGPSRE
nr:MAG TPA: hypothetical protein [Caudoviricetes sp.]